jgi:hypothetical protein
MAAMKGMEAFAGIIRHRILGYYIQGRLPGRQ